MLVYFDNASSSFPKPEVVVRANAEALKSLGGNPGRAGNRMSLDAARVILGAREKVASLLNASDPSRIIFTYNATMALNMALKGLLHEGGHVVTTSMEHNSVMRPLYSLQRAGVEFESVLCDREGRLNPEAVMEAVRPETKLIALIHASNVTGTINRVGDVGKWARRRGIPLLVDAAQTAGALNIDVEADCIDLLACPGHKGLMGPQGTGVLYVGRNIELEPLLEGGTGSNSEMMTQPSFLPDRYESGTQNTPGIAALGAAVDFILQTGVDEIRKHETGLTVQLIEGLMVMDRVELFGPVKAEERMPVIPFRIDGLDPAFVGQKLDDDFGIMTRVGLHCSPQAHETLGTFPQGTVRVSIGYFNTGEEVQYFLDSIKTLIKK